MKILAITVLVSYGISLLMGANAIGKPRKPVTTGIYIATLPIVSAAMYLIWKAYL